jgi:orotate phosphoribosyltransferase
MKNYQHAFIKFAIERKALLFGEFKLKSGRISPYFFNAGVFNQGDDLLHLARAYASVITQHAPQYDVLFGPAYKGIPLVSTTATILASEFKQNRPYCFNRKEKKNHGEGGQLVGADISHRKVLIIDDVITAGTAIRESMQFLNEYQAKLAGVIIALDRQERGQNEKSAIQEIENQYDVPVISIIKLDDIIEYLKQHTELAKYAETIEAYHHNVA